MATPLVFGGRGAHGLLTFETTSLFAAAIVFVTAAWRGERVRLHVLDGLAALLIGVVTLQLVPLPAEWIAALSPHQSELLPAWGDATTKLPAWDRLSLSPWITRRHLGQFCCGLLLYLAMRHRAQQPAALSRLAWVLGVFGPALSAFALAQYLVGNGRYYFLYDSPFLDTNNGAKGPFVNTNHFGGFAVLTIPATLWLVLNGRSDDAAARPRSRSRSGSAGGFGSTNKGTPETLLPSCSRGQVVAAGGLVLTLSAIAMSWSRAAMIGAGLAVMGYLLLHRRGGQKLGPILVVTLVCGAGLLLSLTVAGERVESQLQENVQSLATTDIEKLDSTQGRRAIWAVTIDGIRQFPLVGTGLGSHRTVYQHFWQGPNNNRVYSHVENGPLQFALECGLVASGVLLLGILVVMGSAVRRLRQTGSSTDRGLAAVPLVMLGTHLVHCLSDFVWHAPGCMVVVAAAAAVVTARRPQGEASDDSTPALPAEPTGGLALSGRLLAGGTLGLVATVAALSLPTSMQQVAAERPWHQYVRLVGEEAATIPNRAELQLQTIQATTAASPLCPDYLSREARTLMFAFENAQGESGQLELAGLRDAVRAGGFGETTQIREWLMKDGVAGENLRLLAAARERARRAIEQSPLMPAMYVILARTNFLDEASPDPAVDRPWFDQAVACAPDEAASQFELGRELMRTGQLDDALEAWRVAFHHDYRYQKQITMLLATTVPADQLIDLFDPDWGALTRMRSIYALYQRPESEATIVRRLGVLWEERAATEAGLTAMHCYRRAYNCYFEVGQYEQCERAARAAIEAAPNSFESRHLLGTFLIHQQRYDEATPHLDWCLRQKPHNANLQKQAARCTQLADLARRSPPTSDGVRPAAATFGATSPASGGVTPADVMAPAAGSTNGAAFGPPLR